MIKEYIKQIKAGLSVTKAIQPYVDKCLADKKGAVLEIFSDWKEHAKRVDQKIKRGEKLGKLAGVPVTIKDNLMYKGHRVQAASKILNGFVAPYTATVVQKLLDEDAIIIARVDMDEFAMGGLGRYALNGPVKNAHSDEHHAGGSSSGSAVAVACGYCLASLGSDTAGSVRYPAALNGIVGVKPTYGSVSRYGAVAFGSNLEQVGVFAQNIQDAQLVLDVISGKCPNDATSLSKPKDSPKKTDKVVFGRVKELWDALAQTEVAPHYEKILQKLKSTGAKIIDLSMPNITKSINCYYALAPTQAASNLARFDGVKYGASAPDVETLSELYEKTRSAGFGAEVKRRILLGNLMLAQQSEPNISSMKDKIAAEFASAFERVDILIMPTGGGVAPKIGEPMDPVQDYLVDLFTVPSNMSGTPAISIPCGTHDVLPLGLQIVANKWCESQMFATATMLQKEVLK